MKNMLNGGLILGLLVLGSISLKADVDLYISDTTDHVGVVDLTTDTVVSVKNYGIDLHDLAFTANGNFYGTSMTALYSLSTTTASGTLISAYGSGVGGNDINGLVGDGNNLLAGSFVTKNIYAVDVSPFSVKALTGTASYQSQGDIAFGPAGNSGPLYDSLSNGDLDAITISGTTIVSNDVIGKLNVSGVPVAQITGLATVGSVTYAVAGTEVYIVDLANADMTPIFSFAGKLSTASGLAAPPSLLTVPEPTNLALLIAGVAGLALYQSRRRVQA